MKCFNEIKVIAFNIMTKCKKSNAQNAINKIASKVKLRSVNKYVSM